MSLLTSLISTAGSPEHGASNCSLLFIGGCRIDEGLTKEVVLLNLQQELTKCECITLPGFSVESLNEMMSEVLCLPRRKTLPLSETIYEKTLGMPLLVIEVSNIMIVHSFWRIDSNIVNEFQSIIQSVDTMLAEELLTESDKFGWEWDIHAINRKPIAKGAAELLLRKVETLPAAVIRGLKILSCFESHMDFNGIDMRVIDAVKDHSPNDSLDIDAALDAAAKNFIINIGMTTVAFSHELIQNSLYEMIPTMDRIPLLLKLITCLVTKCRMDSSGSLDFILATANLMNKIGSDYMVSNHQQSQLFAEYNLEAGRRLIEEAKFATALEYLQTGTTYLQGNVWETNHYLAIGIFNNMAVASYSLGNPDECLAHANQVFEHAATFEDKFMAYCVFIKLLGEESHERAIEKLIYLLPFVWEPVDPNAITQSMALDEMISLKEALAGNQKAVFLQPNRMTDNRMLMAMKLLGLLVLYSSQQKAFLSGYLATRMIRMSMQYGNCEDTVYALSVFSSSLCYTVNHVDEAYSLAQVALAMTKSHNTDHLIPRVYGLLYGTVLSMKDPLQSTLAPLSKACHLAFSQGVHDHTVLNTLVYVRRCLYSGKDLPTLMDELASLTEKHVSSCICIL